MIDFSKEYLGSAVIIRSYDSGVHFGYVSGYDPVTRHVQLKNSRRLYKWRGFTLSAIANDGMYDEKAEICQRLDDITVANVIEIIPCTEKSIQNISNYPVYNPYE